MMIAWIVVGAVLVIAAAAVVIIHYILFTNQKTPVFDYFSRKRRDPVFQAHRDAAAEQLRHTACREYTHTSSRGEILRGYYYPCGETPTGRIVVMTHGLGSDHWDACGMYVRYYHERRFDVFCCEASGMKRRRGRYVSYGVWESEDCLEWLGVLTERFGEHIEIVLHGFSMGASTLLRICDRCPPQVRFLVSDSAFSDADRLLHQRLHMLYPPVRLYQRLRVGVDMRETNVRPHVQNSRCPILFVHGEEDNVVPFAMGQELYACCGAEKAHLWVKGAVHVASWHTDEAAYRARLDAFLTRYVADR